MRARSALAARLRAHSDSISQARALIFIAMRALTHGDTDLEIQASRTLELAYDWLTRTDDDLVAETMSSTSGRINRPGVVSSNPGKAS